MKQLDSLSSLLYFTVFFSSCFFSSRLVLYWGTPLTIPMWTSSYSLSFQTIWPKSSCHKAAEKERTLRFISQCHSYKIFQNLQKTVKKPHQPSVSQVNEFVLLPLWDVLLHCFLLLLVFGLKLLHNLKSNGQGFLKHEETQYHKESVHKM